MKILIAVGAFLYFCWLSDLLIEPTWYQPDPKWQPISAHVISLRPQFVARKDQRARVTYQFDLGGKSYQKCMWQKFPLSDLTRSSDVQALKDKVVLAYYDPADPNQSVSPEIGRIYAKWNSFWISLNFLGLFLVFFLSVAFKKMSQFGGGDGVNSSFT
jgi:hypothetical protein